MSKMTTITTEDVEIISMLHQKLNEILNPQEKRSRDERYIFTNPSQVKPDQFEEAKKAIEAVAQRPLSPIVERYLNQLLQQILKKDLKHYRYISNK